jgi:hypothetical protein
MDAKGEHANDDQRRQYARMNGSRSIDGFHGHATDILLAKFMPIPMLA